MLRRFLIGLSTIIFATGILTTSIFKSASVPSYAFSLPATPLPQTSVLGESEEKEINYHLPYPGKIFPDSPFWPVKALRDKVWLLVTRNGGKKAELKLLFADKRLLSAKFLFEKDKPELALTTLNKGERYLDEALTQEEKNRSEGADTSEFLLKLVNASLKHTEVIEEILLIAPSDARPEIIKTGDYAKNAYEKTKQRLQGMGLEAPEDLFDGE